MKTSFLFPPKLKYLGALLAIPGSVLGYFIVYKNYEIPGFEIRLRERSSLLLSANENFTNELALTLVIIGLLLVAFSRVKKEDELTAKIRQDALYWAILVNYALYAFLLLGVFIGYVAKYPLLNNIIGALTNNLEYTVFNFFTPLLIFIDRFYFLLYRNKNEFYIRPVHYLPCKPYQFLGQWLSITIIAIVAANMTFNWSGAISYLFWLLPLNLLLWVYSSEKNEDEYINAIRLDAMQLAVYVN
jgi:hypothetical protein